MKNVLFTIMTILSFFFIKAQNNQKTIDINVKNSSSLNLSKMAKGVTMMSLLHPKDYSLYNINEIVLTDNFFIYYVVVRKIKGFQNMYCNSI